MNLRPLYDPRDGQMRVAGFMSGSGSNLREIIKYERRLKSERGKSPFQMVVLFSDTFDSNAPTIGRDYDIPVLMRDIKGFYLAQCKSLRDMKVREEFDRLTVRALAPFDVSVVALGGYMSIVSAPLMNSFLGVNVHPADLGIKRENGKPKYTGDDAVKKAILAGEKVLRSSTHIVEPEVDCGRVLIVSSPLELKLGENFDPSNGELVKRVAKENQDRLKEVGDWEIFPKTLLFIAQGRYQVDDNGRLYFDGTPIPIGLRS